MAPAKSAARAGIGIGVALGIAIEIGFVSPQKPEFVRNGNPMATATPIAIPMPTPTRRQDFAGALSGFASLLIPPKIWL